MQIKFWKMHGAANDFVLVDDREGNFPVDNRDYIERIAQRRTGIGCEGVILIQPSDTEDFRMRFFNPDGGEVDMCGNGARCVARLAADIGAAPRKMTIATQAGRLRAEITQPGQVKLWLTEPANWRMQQKLTVAGRELVCHSVNTGVAHVVVPVPDLDAVDVAGAGSAIRYHEAFAPEGTNANFFQVTGPSSVAVRTYERGVEAETLACGTGIVATGLVAGRLGHVKPPVAVASAGGHQLIVDYRMSGNGNDVDAVTLEGPAEYVFTGEIAAGDGCQP